MENAVKFNYVLNGTSRIIRKRFEQHALQFGLTFSQSRLLSHLSLNNGTNQKKLARLIGIEPASLVRLLDRMEKQNLIERCESTSDRRISHIFITTKAVSVIDLIRAASNKTFHEGTLNLSIQDQETPINLLEKVMINLNHACQH